MKLLVLSPDQLRKGEKLAADAPPKLEDALAATLIASIDAHMQLSRVAQLGKRDRSQKPPDIAGHYVFPITAGLVSDSLLHTVIECYRIAGWKHSRLLVGNVVIAREPFDVGAGRGQKQLPAFA